MRKAMYTVRHSQPRQLCGTMQDMLEITIRHRFGCFQEEKMQTITTLKKCIMMDPWLFVVGKKLVISVTVMTLTAQKKEERVFLNTNRTPPIFLLCYMLLPMKSRKVTSYWQKKVEQILSAWVLLQVTITLIPTHLMVYIVERFNGLIKVYGNVMQY